MATWIYRVRWANPYTFDQQSAGKDYELAIAEVPSGTPCPKELEQLAARNFGYGIVLTFNNGPRKQWTPERKGKRRRQLLHQRIQRDAPLFADELLQRELQRRPTYYDGTSR